MAAFCKSILNETIRACAAVQGERGEEILAFLDAWNWEGAPEEGELDAFCRAADRWWKSISDPEKRAHYYRVCHLQIGKSNLLFRVLEEGEEIREYPCPLHEGTWSGLDFGDAVAEIFLNHHCSLCQMTGWMKQPLKNQQLFERMKTVQDAPTYEPETMASSIALIQYAYGVLMELLRRGVSEPEIEITTGGVHAFWNLPKSHETVAIHIAEAGNILVCKTGSQPMAAVESSLPVLASILLERPIPGVKRAEPEAESSTAS